MGVAKHRRRGGNIVKVKESYTGQYLKPVLARRPKEVGKKQAAE